MVNTRKTFNNMLQDLGPVKQSCRDLERQAPMSEVQAPSDKQQAIDETVPYNDIEEAQASSFKPQAPRSKRQASSTKRQAKFPSSLKKE